MAEAKDTAVKFVAAFNAHDERALLALHAANIKFEAPGGVHVNTTAEATAYAMRWLKGFPNGKMTVRNEIESGPWIIQEITMEGVHSGPFQTPTSIVPPTGKKLVGKGVQILRVENGQITEARLYFDQLDMLSQLGLLPVPATV
ncbi:MAG: ester cyclase [Isosphaeraceae bacterium]